MTTSIDLDWKLKNIDLKDMEGDEDVVHAGRLVAGLLARQTDAKSPVKSWDWSMQLYKKESLALDSSDFEDLKNFIRTHKTLFAMAQAQILNYLNSIKEDLKK